MHFARHLWNHRSVLKIQLAILQLILLYRKHKLMVQKNLQELNSHLMNQQPSSLNRCFLQCELNLILEPFLKEVEGVFSAKRSVQLAFRNLSAFTTYLHQTFFHFGDKFPGRQATCGNERWIWRWPFGGWRYWRLCTRLTTYLRCPFQSES